MRVTMSPLLIPSNCWTAQLFTSTTSPLKCGFGFKVGCRENKWRYIKHALGFQGNDHIHYRVVTIYQKTVSYGYFYPPWSKFLAIKLIFSFLFWIMKINVSNTWKLNFEWLFCQLVSSPKYICTVAHWCNLHWLWTLGLLVHRKKKEKTWYSLISIGQFFKMLSSSVKETVLFSFLLFVLHENGRSLRFPRIFKLGDWMIKQSLNSVIAKYCDLSVSCRSIICLSQ